ncbi:MAG: hypothetical protein GX770_07180 [Firmicutes bacterium]|nr:hypothetical protein [Bacillota bacterium]
METVEASVKKLSGSASAGYGIVFCLQNENNFYTLISNIQGEYLIVKMVNGEWYVVDEWYDNDAGIIKNGDMVYSQYLHLGYGYDDVENQIKVKYNNDNTFTISFNGQEAATFKDGSFSGGYYGFYAETGSAEDENFPDEPVEVWFKLHQPVIVEQDRASHQISTYRFNSLNFASGKLINE